MGPSLPVSTPPVRTHDEPASAPEPVDPLLAYLADHGGVATLGAIAEHLAAARIAQPTTDVRGDPVLLELADLSRRRLPWLVEAGAVRVLEDEHTTVELRPVDDRPRLGGL